uniref:Uncharacterized protein n=1 Tax=Sinocyclocheilus anshuiensis TaxID=1608454 RepID=A0A671MK96_9TELE
MAFRKAVKGTLIGGGAIATAFGLSQFFEYRKNQVLPQLFTPICTTACLVLIQEC